MSEKIEVRYWIVRMYELPGLYVRYFDGTKWLCAKGNYEVSWGTDRVEPISRLLEQSEVEGKVKQPTVSKWFTGKLCIEASLERTIERVLER